MIGGREGGIDVAEAELLVVVYVVINEGVLRIGIVDDWCAGLQRIFDVEHGRQRLVVDPHLRDRLEGLALAVGDDGQDRLALVADLVDGQRRLVVLAEIDQAQEAC